MQVKALQHFKASTRLGSSQEDVAFRRNVAIICAAPLCLHVLAVSAV